MALTESKHIVTQRIPFFVKCIFIDISNVIRAQCYNIGLIFFMKDRNQRVGLQLMECFK